MNDVTVVTSVTYPSPESLALVADVQYHEPYLSAALNRKFRGIVDPGFYAGFLPKPGGGMNLLITSVDGDKTAGAASVDIGEFYQVTIQHRKDISLALNAGKKYAIVLKGRYLLGEDTYQVNTASHIHAAEFVARTYTDSYQLGDGELLVCTVNIPAGVSTITQEMIDTSERINRTIGIDISDSVTSTRSDVAASSLAVKKAYDLAKSKYTAQDASTTQKGLVQLSSETNSDSETMAATPKAVKSVKDLADTKAPIESPSLTGTPTAPTAAQGTNNTQIATTAYVRAAISALVGSSPEALDTLNELAEALGNDPNFATTMTNALAGKQPLDATLTALAGLPTGANKLPYFTGKDTVAQTDLTPVGRDILAKSSTQAIIQYLGLGEGSALPVGVPVPWPSATPPTGWLKCNGAPFSAEEYPKLAKVYPTNELPDLRGEFIRGWDDGRGVDAGRALLSIQTGMLEKHRHIVVANDWYDSKEEWELATIFRRAYTQGRGLDAADVGGTLIPSPTLHTRGSIGNTGGSETRPRNIAFNFIVRAA
ncbi:phage tail protein [Salmonella enterica subsp. enterica serovar Derby]|nr:phage tail protein [Salmonella enterica subsp. enterica serovar Derby]ECU6588741.1 phage tail protein [Salmonella enterica subsp. enterica serovar Derby]